MSTVERLTEEQCQLLAGIQIGDLLLVDRFPKAVVYSESDSGSDSDHSETEHPEDESVDIEANADTEEGNGDTDLEAAEESVSEGEDEGDGVSNEEIPEIYGAAVWKVVSLKKDAEGAMEDISLCLLEYCSKAADATSTSYSIYGRRVEHRSISLSGFAGEIEVVSVNEVLGESSTTGYNIKVKPNGSDIYSDVFHSQCPASCNDGWVATQEEMHEMINESMTTLSPYMPVCPVCIGITLMKEYHTLRETFENTNMADLTAVIDFYGRLNPRRRSRGHSFKQLDEREWGYMFDDMLQEDEEDGNDDGQWDYYDEAMDPNGGAIFHGATDAAIASLPRKVFGKVEKTDGQSTCLVCRDNFTADTVVAVLPCEHFFCDGGCAESWLKQSSSCPTCRTKLPKGEEDQKDGEDA